MHKSGNTHETQADLPGGEQKAELDGLSTHGRASDNEDSPNDGVTVRCPHCHFAQPGVTVGVSAPLRCDACGNRFSLVDMGLDSTADHKRKVLGHFELLDRLGSGAFGTVWRARDTKLERTVALKVPHHLNLESDDAEKVWREARAAAQLKHPNIVAVHEVGWADHSLYIVQDLVNGVPLSEWLEKRKFTIRGAAKVALRIAEVLDHAHEHGVIHRDLKPSNIILDQSGHPHLMDFGLARRERSDATVTVEGQILGTPAYMSPEQADGRGHEADARSDIYSFGVVLFQLLTGELPFRGSIRMLMHQVIHDEAPQLRRLNSIVPKDLETVCMKCLQKRPEDRYQSARAVASDLTSWLEGEPVSVRPVSMAERAWRWCRRRPAIASLIGSIILISAISMATIAWLWQINVAERQKLTNQTVTSYLTGSLSSQPGLLKHVRSVLPQVEGELQVRLHDSALDSRSRALILLALLHQHGKAPTELMQMVVSGDLSGVNLPLVRRELAAYSNRFENDLWRDALNPPSDMKTDQWLQLAALLAEYSPDSPRWSEISAEVVRRLISADHQASELMRAFQPIKSQLLPELKRHFKSGASKTHRTRAAQAISAYAANDVAMLVDLLAMADGTQHHTLVETLRQSSRSAVAELESRLDRADAAKFDTAELEKFWQSQANIALALLALEHADAVWPLFRHADDPRLQTYLIHWAASRGVNSRLLIHCVIQEQDPGALYALLLTIGGYEPGSVNRRLRRELQAWCLDAYKQHGDSGVHSAIAWLMTEWGQGDRIASMNEQLKKDGVSENRDWYHNYFGQCMVILRNIESLHIETDNEKAPASAPQQWSYAIAATETTTAQYHHVAAKSPAALGKPADDDDGPIRHFSLAETVSFCRTLSHLEFEGEKLPALQWEANEPRLIRVDLTREGYRLPMAEEWEYACRSSLTTSLCFGTSVTPFLDSYAHIDVRGNVTAVAAKLKPNRIGLFDFYGNAYERVLSRQQEGRSSTWQLVFKLNADRDITWLLGGSVRTKPSFFTTTPAIPAVGRLRTGIRIARTMSSH